MHCFQSYFNSIRTLIKRTKHLQSPLSLRKQITSPVPGASGGKNTPTSPLAVPNNSFKVSSFNHSGASSAPYDAFDYEIDTWSNDQYTEHCKNQAKLAQQEMVIFFSNLGLN